MPTYIPKPTVPPKCPLHILPTATTCNPYMSMPWSSYSGTPINMMPVSAIVATRAVLIMITLARTTPSISPIGMRFRMPTSVTLAGARTTSPVLPISACFCLPMIRGQPPVGKAIGTGTRVVVPKSRKSRAMGKAWLKVETADLGRHNRSGMVRRWRVQKQHGWEPDRSR